VKDHHPADGILETARAQDCDLIVMASHGRRGLSRLLLGSQANKVVTLSPTPVLICR
jgi:nucleotide-binding universal stress UspA family protein